MEPATLKFSQGFLGYADDERPKLPTNLFRAVRVVLRHGRAADQTGSTLERDLALAEVMDRVFWTNGVPHRRRAEVLAGSPEWVVRVGKHADQRRNLSRTSAGYVPEYAERRNGSAASRDASSTTKAGLH